ncbi:DUF6879 family protein [Nocardia sp. CNY236]|uniref:DUF6879 family protein n=1 Tax=Nocardia sp. CNY236 TaxID=1169152 RepID=UPI001E472509|nr:DUF6879 family protein [Nocardia sp. CNY236]
MEFRTATELLQESRNEVFHLEVRDSYGEPGEDEAFRCFVNNEPFDYREWFQDWYDFVKELTARSVSVSRVRVVTVPHSDYQRWLLTLTTLNVEAGEDIRYLPRHLAGKLPRDDWWLVDSETVVFNLSDKDGRSVGGSAVTTDPEIVSYCRNVRDRLWSLAMPYAEYTQVMSQQ